MIKPRSTWPVLNQWSVKNDECIVVGAHAFILRVSSIFGLAPLRFKPYGNGYIVSISFPMCIYSYLVKIAFFLLTLLVLVTELNLVSPYAHRTSRLSQVMFCIHIMVFLMLAITGVYGSPRRMKQMIKFMNIIALMDKNNGGKYSHARERRLKAVCIFFIVSFSILMADGIIFSVQTTIILDYWLYGCYYVGFITVPLIAVVLELQFSVTAMAVCKRLRQVNHELGVIAYSLEETSFLLPLTSAREAVHRLAILHGKLIDVVQQLEDSYSVCLLISLLSKLFHLIISPYFAINQYNVRVSDGTWNHFLALQTSWYAFHLLMLFMLVEPCQYTTTEGHRTEILVRRMLSTSDGDGLLTSRLEVFSRQLMLQPVSYKPLGIVTLDRPLIASIFGAVATYLVILIQFQKYES